MAWCEDLPIRTFNIKCGRSSHALFEEETQGDRDKQCVSHKEQRGARSRSCEEGRASGGLHSLGDKEVLADRGKRISDTVS